MHHHRTGQRAALAAAAVGAALAASFSTPAIAHGDGHHTARPQAGHAAAARHSPYGRPGDARQASRSITVDMADNMRFTPALLTVQRGETVRLQLVNSGRLLHEFVLGTPEEIQAHREEMKKHPGMDHHAPQMVHVKPGRQGALVWQFTQPGEFQFACLLPGHFEAGMLGKVVVQ